VPLVHLHRCQCHQRDPGCDRVHHQSRHHTRLPRPACGILAKFLRSLDSRLRRYVKFDGALASQAPRSGVVMAFTARKPPRRATDPLCNLRGCLPVFPRPRAAARQRAGYPKSSPARRPFRRARAGQPPGATLRFPARQPPRHAQAPTAVTAQTSLPTTAPAAVPSHQPPARGIPADGRAETPCSGHTANPQCTHCGSHAAMP